MKIQGEKHWQKLVSHQYLVASAECNAAMNPLVQSKLRIADATSPLKDESKIVVGVHIWEPQRGINAVVWL
jgi:hypothetical protein